MNIIKNLNRKCPICNGRDAEALSEFNYSLFDDCPLDDYSDLVACNNCGFIFFDTINNQMEFDEFYKNHYLISAYYTIMENHPADKVHQEFTSDFLLSSGVRKDESIYDVGCGAGRLLKHLDKQGFSNVNGVELFEDYVERLKQDGIKATVGNAYHLEVKDGEADCVIYKHVLEHLLNLHGAILEMRRVLCDGGVAVIELPDAGNYAAFEDFSPLHYFIIEHINYFDLHHLESVFNMHGFTLIEAQHKMLDIAEIYPVPVLLCSFRKEAAPTTKEVTPDFSLREDIKTWFPEKPMFYYPQLEEIVNSNKSVYIWGLSYRTMMEVAMSQIKDCNIQAFLDSDVRKQGKVILGKKVISPDILNTLENDAVVITGVGPSSRKMQTILAEIEFSGEVVILN